MASPSTAGSAARPRRRGDRGVRAGRARARRGARGSAWSTATSSRATSCSARDGRVRVGDFGLAIRDLARSTVPHGAPTPPSRRDLTQPARSSARRRTWRPSSATAAPSMRAPIRFSLCLALAEALLGERPPSDADPGGAREARDRIAPWPAIARGLAVRPADRWPDLDPLIAALTGRRQRPWRPIAIGVGAVGLVAAIGITVVVRAQAPIRSARTTIAAGSPGVGRRGRAIALPASCRRPGCPERLPTRRRPSAACIDSRATDYAAKGDRHACEDTVTAPSGRPVLAGARGGARRADRQARRAGSADRRCAHRRPPRAAFAIGVRHRCGGSPIT